MRQSRNVREVRKHRRKRTASSIGTGESSSFQTYSVNAIMFAVFVAGIQLACTNFIEQIREVFPCMEPYTRFHGWTTRIWTGISRRYLYWWQPRRDMYPPSRRAANGWNLFRRCLRAILFDFKFHRIRILPLSPAVSLATSTYHGVPVLMETWQDNDKISISII